MNVAQIQSSGPELFGNRSVSQTVDCKEATPSLEIEIPQSISHLPHLIPQQRKINTITLTPGPTHPKPPPSKQIIFFNPANQTYKHLSLSSFIVASLQPAAFVVPSAAPALCGHTCPAGRCHRPSPVAHFIVKNFCRHGFWMFLGSWFICGYLIRKVR